MDKAKSVRVPSYKIPPAYLRMFPNSEMLYSARVNYDISCPMSFEDYPADVQVCRISFESWGSTSEQMDFRWKPDDTIVNKNIKLNQHDFNVSFDNGINTGYSTGVYPHVVMKLTLTRKLSYHLLRTYLPSMLFVILAWFSMFIPLEHVPGEWSGSLCRKNMLMKGSVPVDWLQAHSEFPLLGETNGFLI